MAERSFMFNYNPVADNEYGQEVTAAMFNHGFLDGVSYTKYGDSLAVEASTLGSVIVSPGIMRTQGYFYENDAPLTLALPAFTPGQPRTDRIVTRLNISADGFSIHAVVKSGTDGSTEPPLLTRAGNIYERSLAQAKYDGDSTIIVEDERKDEEACGNFRPESQTEVVEALRGHIATMATATNPGHMSSTDKEKLDFGVVTSVNGEPGDVTLTATDVGAVPAPSGTAPGSVTSVNDNFTPANESPSGTAYFYLSWSDPTDENWFETIVVRKMAIIGSSTPYPTSEFDGEVVMTNRVRDRFATVASPLVTIDLAPGNRYYYRIFTRNRFGLTDIGNSVMVPTFTVPLDRPFPRIAAGTVVVTPSAANTPTPVSVTFPAGLFTKIPSVTVSAETTVPGYHVTGVSYAGVSITGCTIYGTRTNTSAFTVSWQAMQLS